MTTQEYLWLYDKGLDQLNAELEAYASEEALWIVAGSVKNSAGNLAQHLVGNLQHFIGKHMGDSDYVRNRNSEFEQRLFDRKQLLDLVQTTRESIHAALRGKDAAFMAQPYDTAIVQIKEGQTNGFMLAYLYAHLNYHLGQINYHRRLLAQNQ